MYDMLKPIDDGIEILSIKLESKKGGKSDIKYAYPETIRIAVITCSDSISGGISVDRSGEIIVEHLAKHKLSVEVKEIIADEFDTIQATAKNLINQGFNLILFTGGTGLSSRDVTPDAISPLIDSNGGDKKLWSAANALCNVKQGHCRFCR
jgi:molybdenum cofactor synthesis domain-containing protein